MDGLRGFASLGIILVNIFAFSGYGWMTETQINALPTAQWDKPVALLLNVLINTKLITLFSILFGTGFYLQLEKAKQLKLPFEGYFIKRMLLLLSLACVHAYLFWYGDIIRYYAVAGLFLILLRNASPSTILWLSIIFSVPLTGLVFILKSALPFTLENYPTREQILAAFSSTSYLEMLQMNWRIDPINNFLRDSPITITSVFGKILIGYWLGQSGFFLNIDRFRNQINSWIWGGLTFGIASSIAYWAIENDRISLDSLWLIWVPFAVAAGLIWHSLFYLGLFVRFQTKMPHMSVFKAFNAVGKMALSNYLGQTLLCLFIFYPSVPGFKLIGRVGPAGLVVLSCIVFFIQVVFSRYWLRSHNLGPVEWFWKKLAYQGFK